MADSNIEELNTTIRLSNASRGGLRIGGRSVGTAKKTFTELAQNQREASSRWYYNSHEYRSTHKKKYYEENLDRILEQRKQTKEEL